MFYYRFVLHQVTARAWFVWYFPASGWLAVFFYKSKAVQDFEPVTTSWNCFQSRLSTLLPCWTREFTRDADKIYSFLVRAAQPLKELKSALLLKITSSASSWADTQYPLPCTSAFPLFSPHLKLELSPSLNYGFEVWAFGGFGKRGQPGRHSKTPRLPHGHSLNHSIHQGDRHDGDCEPLLPIFNQI